MSIGSAPTQPLTSQISPRLMTVGVCELAAFVALEECGGFTRAAAFLHLSQPGVSARVRRLERALGCELVDRSVRKLTFTPAGEVFLPEARILLAVLLRGHSRASQPHRTRATVPQALPA